MRFPDPSASAKVPIGKNVFAVNGLSLKITCNYVGLPKPQISWYFNRSKIERNEKFPVGKNTDDLIIPKMSRRYEGMYSCIALQGTRKTYGTSVVKVLGKKYSVKINLPLLRNKRLLKKHLAF